MERSALGKTAVALLEYAMFASIIALAGSVWVRQGILYERLNILRIVVLIFPLMIFCIKTLRSGLKYCRLPIIWLCVFSLSGVVSWLVSPGQGVFLVVGPSLAFLLYSSTFNCFEDLAVTLNRFVNLVVLIASVSLFFFLLGTVMGVISPTGKEVYEWEYTRVAPSYFNLYYETQQIDFLFYGGMRNCGIFCEAPMFNFILCMALAIQVFVLHNGRAKISILLLTILSTFSTTGYVVLVLILLVKISTIRVRGRHWKAFRAAFGLLLCFVGVVLVIIVIGDKSSTSSYGVRSDHLLGCIKLFLDTFPIGTGFNNPWLFEKVLFFDQGMSVGLAYYLAQAGILGCAVFFGPLVGSIKKTIVSHQYEYLGVLLTLFWLFFTTSVVSSSVLWCMLCLLHVALPTVICVEAGRTVSR